MNNQLLDEAWARWQTYTPEKREAQAQRILGVSADEVRSKADILRLIEAKLRQRRSAPTERDLALQLAREVASLNANCPTIGPGKLANMQALAQQILGERSSQK